MASPSHISIFSKRRYLILIASVSIVVIFVLFSSSQTPIKEYSPEKSAQVTPADLPSSILWMANMETGDLSQWMSHKSNKPWQDSGICKRPENGVIRDTVHTGEYAMKMTIQSWFPHSGCRQFRYPEARTGDPLYYSAWIYFPEEYNVQGWTNVMQFKAKRYVDEGKPSQVFWSIRLMTQENGKNYFQLSWKGGEGQMTGPTASDTEIQPKIYQQTVREVPANKWIHVELFLKQSSDFDGHIIVWQDGTEIFNVPNIRTKFPDGYNSWSVNSYGAGIQPPTFTVYVDDAVISRERIGPDFNRFTIQ